jgi:CheY-like chemotaxis protein
MTPRRPAALIVEDQPFVGMVASDILKESGYETFHAFDANDATALLRAHPEIEIVVTEAKLPGEINGLELCRQVSAQRPDVKLVVTAENDLPAGDIPNGARVLHKPYASGELKTLIAAKALLDA